MGFFTQAQVPMALISFNVSSFRICCSCMASLALRTIVESPKERSGIVLRSARNSRCGGSRSKVGCSTTGNA